MQTWTSLLLLSAPLLSAPLLGTAALAQGGVSLADRLLAAASIPALARDMRNAGVADRDVGGVLDILRQKSVRADDAREILKEGAVGARNHGPVDNFGAFVQMKLDQGLRGRDLAAAIRSEHVARGKKSAARGKSGAAPGRGRDDAPAGGKKDEHDGHDAAGDTGKGKGQGQGAGAQGGVKQRGPR